MRTAFVTAVAGACTVAGAQNVTFSGLGRGPNPNGRSLAYCVSLDGNVVGGAATAAGADPGGPSGGYQAFRWTSSGGLQLFGPVLGEPFSATHGLSGDGSVAVGTTFGHTQHGWRWTTAGGMAPIGPLPGDDGSDAGSVSADGSVVAVRSYLPAFGYSAGRWTAQTGVVNIGSLGGQTYIGEISADGQVIVGGSNGTAFRWTSATGMQPMDGSGVSAVNADGSVIVGSTLIDPNTSTYMAFRWTAGGSEVLMDSSGHYMSQANAVSGDGEIVVGLAFVEGPPLPMYWRRGVVFANLNEYLVARGSDLTGWLLEEVTDVSGDGQVVVGSGLHNGLWEAWVAHIPRCGSADFDGDGDLGTDADIEAFFACLAGNCCATCGSADFNTDGDTGTDADIEAFFRVLAGGSC